ncbi:MAG: DNA cytosine methyltransferase [Pseudolabrys sp.]
MPRKILVADLLCGAGGSSTGAARALAELGLQMELVCVNHWGVAIETHKRNHPEARHYCQDISTVRPHIIVPEGYLDLLMASPTCTHHSVARGGKPTSDQQRSDPWHIITWLTELRVKRMIIENVWEFIGWGPVDARTGKPIKSRKGEYFNTWIKTIRGLGFEPEWRKLNAADFGDATTRQRFILMARSDRRRVAWPVPTHTKRATDKLELFPGMQPWKPARDIIDWQIRGKSIFTRKKPLAPKTLARIYAGAVKFGWPEPFLVVLRNHMAGQSLDRPLPTIAANGKHIGLAQPVMVANRSDNAPKNPASDPAPCFTTAPGGGVAIAQPVVIATANGNDPRESDPSSRRARDVDQPLGTIHAGGGNFGVAEPVVVRTNMHGRKSPGARGAQDPLMTITTDGGIAVAEPVIMNGRKGNQAKAVSVDPIPTLDTKGGVWLAEPLILSQHNSGAPRCADEPLPTITTGGAAADNHPGCARPMLIEPLILNRNSAPRGETRPISEPAPTPTTSGGGYLVQPFVMSRHSEGAPRSVEEPTPTQVARHSHALISPYYGSGSGETCNHVEEPLPTVTAKARFGMIVPITHSDGSDRARDTATDPIPTITTANRGELAFITAQHGERPGQAPRVHDVTQPVPTIAATGHVDLVQPTAEYDILFRMLEPHELAAAMGFTGDDINYEFAGTKTEQIKQIGNAVSVAKMRACVKAIMGDAAATAAPESAKRPEARSA